MGDNANAGYPQIVEPTADDNYKTAMANYAEAARVAQQAGFTFKDAGSSWQLVTFSLFAITGIGTIWWLFDKTSKRKRR